MLHMLQPDVLAPSVGGQRADLGLHVIKVSRAEIRCQTLREDPSPSPPSRWKLPHSLAHGPASTVKANSITSSNLSGSDPAAALWSPLAHTDHSGKSAHLKILTTAARPLLTGEVTHPTGSRARTWTSLEAITLPQNLYLPYTLSQEVTEDTLHHNMGINETGEDRRSKRRGAGNSSEGRPRTAAQQPEAQQSPRCEQARLQE